MDSSCLKIAKKKKRWATSHVNALYFFTKCSIEEEEQERLRDRRERERERILAEPLWLKNTEPGVELRLLYAHAHACKRGNSTRTSTGTSSVQQPTSRCFDSWEALKKKFHPASQYISNERTKDRLLMASFLRETCLFRVYIYIYLYTWKCNRRNICFTVLEIAHNVWELR